MAELLEALTPTGGVNEAAIDAAVHRLEAGAPVAIPTETVYGLGALTMHREAIARVYELKHRPPDNPLIAHVADGAGLAALTPAATDDRVTALVAAFWPGPLTLVLPRRDDVPPEACGGRDTIAVRCPRHPVATALLEAIGGPISAPSANRSGHVSPTSAGHVASEFAGEQLLVLDGGPCIVGLESTVLDLTVETPRILRPGTVTSDAVRAVLRGTVDDAPVHAQAASPGTRRRHYAPRNAIVAMDADVDVVRAAGGRSCVLVAAGACGTGAEADIGGVAVRLAMPPDAAGWARELYHVTRTADDLVGRGLAEVIVLVRPTGRDGTWAAIHDRIDRMVADAETGEPASA